MWLRTGNPESRQFGSFSDPSNQRSCQRGTTLFDDEDDDEEGEFAQSVTNR